MPKNQNLLKLYELGQSVWYDNLSKAVLDSGELAGLVTQGVTGLTSNPTIFKKAIADSGDYDGELAELSGGGFNAEEICEELMVRDVGRAADLLLPVYEASSGRDGFASIEVSPFLAAETEQTVSAGRRLWKKLGRKNIMIKVPATPAGIPAIQTLLAEGINVNITLIFSVEVYAKVIGAYIAALEERAARNDALQTIASVASFFVSRVDAICEKQFSKLAAEGRAKKEDEKIFLGKVGIANSKLAYALFERAFGSERFTDLRNKGAAVQRPLWASTGTKNPAFKPVMYVEELAGRDTVNTMPPETLDALMRDAQIEPRLHSGLDEARKLIDTELPRLGLAFNELLEELQTAGVASFSDSYRELLTSIENKLKALKR